MRICTERLTDMCAIYEDDEPMLDSLLDGDYTCETTEDYE